MYNTNIVSLEESNKKTLAKNCRLHPHYVYSPTSDEKIILAHKILTSLDSNIIWPRSVIGVIDEL